MEAFPMKTDDWFTFVGESDGVEYRVRTWQGFTITTWIPTDGWAAGSRVWSAARNGVALDGLYTNFRSLVEEINARV